MPGLEAGERAPDVSIPDGRGRRRNLSSFWKLSPAVLVFLRHYG
jgi:hypothetical protein